jgi:hypothetical protein
MGFPQNINHRFSFLEMTVSTDRARHVNIKASTDSARNAVCMSVITSASKAGILEVMYGKCYYTLLVFGILYTRHRLIPGILGYLLAFCWLVSGDYLQRGYLLQYKQRPVSICTELQRECVTPLDQ